jgi:hypothetical protein
MTSIGHSIVGASFSVASLPAGASRRYKFLNLLVFILLANFPDIPMPHWSHDFYDFSHSLLVNLALIMLATAILIQFPKVRKLPGLHRLIILGACAWLSHLLLDTFYNHGKGLLIFWPLSTASLALPIPWFSVLPMEPFLNIVKILKIFLFELLSYVPLLFFSILLRNWQKSRFWSEPVPERSRG